MDKNKTDSKPQSDPFRAWEDMAKERKDIDRNPESVAKAERDDAERAAIRLCHTDLNL